MYSFSVLSIVSKGLFMELVLSTHTYLFNLSHGIMYESSAFASVVKHQSVHGLIVAVERRRSHSRVRELQVLV
jgi:hypothetical protein